MRTMMRRGLLAGAIALALTPAAAQEPTAVDLELLLLADASGSIDDAEIRFQRRGYVDALRDPGLVRAMTAGFHGRVALAYVEWGTVGSQDMVAGWRVIDGEASAEAFAQALLAAPRRAQGRNAIGDALMFATAEIETNAFAGRRKVIDFSADSANNWGGPSIAEGRAAALAADIVINGLAVLCRACSGRPVSYDLEAAFRDQLIGGPGAFVVTADSRETFGAAVRSKLFLEVSGAAPPAPSRLAAHADVTSP
ncbi:MAG: DUF1194 domain-containing protein [Pseudomonadota bacterium]